MKRILFLIGVLSLIASAKSPFAGTWEGKINGLPGIDLTVDDSGEKISGTITFYFQLRGDDGKWRVADKYTVPMIEPKLQNGILSFEVIHYKQHGGSELGPNVKFRMDLTGGDEAFLHRLGLEPDSVKLARRLDKAQFVTVEDGVRLEVLDWGGSGRPVVLLAGYNTAHVYDEFAAKLSETCHVYGITRRGYGASSRPSSGYTAQQSADDVLHVLDSLHLIAPILVGHSFGGQDLSTLGAGHSERIAALVYLNSAEDPTLVFSDYGVEPVDEKKRPAARRDPAPPDHKSFQAYREWQLRTHGVAFPESELRQLFVSNPDGTVGKFIPPNSVRDAMFAGRQKPDYARIRVPVLAFFASPRSPADESAAMQQQYAINLAIMKRHKRDLQNGVPAARVIDLPGANYYVFLSNQAEVLRELRSFVAGLPARGD